MVAGIGGWSRWHQNWYRNGKCQTGSEYNSSIPTLRDGDPREDPLLQEILRGPMVAMEETARRKFTS